MKDTFPGKTLISQRFVSFQEVLASASWFDNIMINHEMSLKVTMFFETFLVNFGD